MDSSEKNKPAGAESLKDLEKASLSTLILSISSSALIHMGLEPKMKDKKNLPIARFNIDMLEVLKEKTKGHLTDSETKLLDHCVNDLKINYVKADS